MKDRAYRIAQKERVIKKRLRLVKAKDLKDKTWYGKLIEKANKLSDSHPLDCGKANCLLCHADKVFKKRKIREQKLLQKAKEQLNEEL